MSGLCGVQNLRKRQIYSRCDGGEEKMPKCEVGWKIETFSTACVNEL